MQRLGSGGPFEDLVGYSRVVRAGDHVWVAGCTAVTEDGVVVAAGDFYEQARLALGNVEAALAQVGARMADVVRTRMYVTDAAQWEAVGRAHGEAFGDIRPVTAMIGVAALLDPRMLVEIEADAYLGAD
ncbi:MAG: RidA family protein [Solirubrobacteraceae bacterium]